MFVSNDLARPEKNGWQNSMLRINFQFLSDNKERSGYLN
jgi:hypothetical protein